MIKAIIFDFDGVILESVDIKTRAFKIMFSDKKEHLDNIIKLHVENGGMSRYEKFKIIYRDFLKEPLSNETLDQLGQKFSDIVYDEVVKCPFVNGAKELLDKYLGKYPMFIVSGTPEGEIRSIVEKRGLSRYFKEVFGAPANKKDLIVRILDKYSYSSNELVFVGDSMNDYNAAKEAGIKFVGRRLSPGFDPFKEVHCESVVDDMREFMELIDEEKI